MERDPLNVELEFLQEFYQHWTELHEMPRDSLNRRKKEHIAQEIVDAHHRLQNFYHPLKLAS